MLVISATNIDIFVHLEIEQAKYEDQTWPEQFCKTQLTLPM